MTTITVYGTIYFEHPIRDWVQEEHQLTVEMELEKGTDMEAYGSTYVPREWCNVLGETWSLDGRQLASWALDWHLRVMGFTPKAIETMKEYARDKRADD